MSSEQTFSTSDLRSTAQDYKREAAAKHKWAFGPVTTMGRAAGGKPRPHRPSETIYNARRREAKGAVAELAHGARVARKQDMLDGYSAAAISDESSSNSAASDYDDTPSPPTEAHNILYSFDAAHAPSHGSQILNAALAKAVKKFEDRETLKLVSDEYEVLNDEGEAVGLTPVKKGKKGRTPPLQAIVVPDADEDWECI